MPCEEGFGAGSDMDAEGVDGGMEAMIASFSSNIRVAKKGTASKSKGPPQYGFYSPDDDDDDDDVPAAFVRRAAHTSPREGRRTSGTSDG